MYRLALISVKFYNKMLADLGYHASLPKSWMNYSIRQHFLPVNAEYMDSRVRNLCIGCGVSNVVDMEKPLISERLDFI